MDKTIKQQRVHRQTENQRVSSLRKRFARFRRAHKPHTRIPDELRAAAVAAVQRGVAPSILKMTCGVSSRQLGQWRPKTTKASVPNGNRLDDVQVLSVVEHDALPLKLTPTSSAVDQELHLRLGSWSVSIRVGESPRNARI